MPARLAVFAAAALLAAPATAEPTASDESRASLRVEDAPRRIVERRGMFDYGGPRLFTEAGVSVFDFAIDTPAGFTQVDDDGRVAATLRVGLGFNRFFATELDVSVLENSDIEVIPDGGGTGAFTPVADPDQVVSFFGRGDWPMTERLTAHGRVGFARINSDIDDPDPALGQLDDAIGPAFGAGLRWNFTGRTGLRADYTRLQLSDTQADQATLVFSVQF